jgi:hypothetical protein
MLELDHVFCMVPPDGDWPQRLADGGWELDAGTRHAGQGTRNRRLAWDGQYLELVWVEDRAEAEANPLRLDRRAEWVATGASPFGIGLRGRLTEEQRPAFWLYADLGFPVWVHRDNERRPERPLLFVLDLPSRRHTSAHRPRAALQAVHHQGPAPVAIPPYAGPGLTYGPGPHRMELVVGSGRPVTVTDLLRIEVADDAGPSPTFATGRDGPPCRTGKAKANRRPRLPGLPIRELSSLVVPVAVAVALVAAEDVHTRVAGRRRTGRVGDH